MKIPNICIGPMIPNIEAAVPDGIPLLARNDTWWKVKAVEIKLGAAPANNSSQNVRVRDALPRETLTSLAV